MNTKTLWVDPAVFGNEPTRIIVYDYERKEIFRVTAMHQDMRDTVRDVLNVLSQHPEITDIEIDAIGAGAVLVEHLARELPNFRRGLMRYERLRLRQ